MSYSARHTLTWTVTPPSDWSRPRVKELFHDDAGNITVEGLSDIDVDHYSIPAFDEYGAPVGEQGASIASNKTLLRGGELLFSKLNSHKPRVWLVPQDENIKVASTEFIALREWHEGTLCMPFARYLLGSAVFADYISCFQTSVTNSHKRIRPEDLWRTRIPFPPLSEQQRIVAFLDASCAAIDAAVVAKRRQLETLDGVRRDIVQRAVTRGLEEHPSLKQTGNVWMNEVPSSWELVSLKRVSGVQTGLTLGKVYEGLLIERAYLRVANVQDGRLNLEDMTTIEVPEEVAHRVELRPDDVLMTEGGDLDKLGRGTIWSGEIPDCLHQNHIFAIRCFKHKLLPAFLAYLTASRYGRDYFEATGKRTTNLANTNSTKVGLFPIPRPSIAEQRAICRFLDEKLNQIDQIVNGIEAQIATLLAYRKSLIHECVTGQRRVKEADVARMKNKVHQI
jgi:type I restriction enzyme, S subunit